MNAWVQGTEGDNVSMGIITDGTKYGIGKDLWFSFPVKVKHHKI